MSSGGNKGQIRRILSIDGGGIKGTMPAAFLAGLEEELGQPIGRYFDLMQAHRRVALSRLALVSAARQRNCSTFTSVAGL